MTLTGSGTQSQGSVAEPISITIPAKPEYVGLCRLTVGGLGRRSGLDSETVADLKVAVTEACSYAIRRSSANGSPESSFPSVTVDVQTGADAWTVTVGTWPKDSGEIGASSEDALGLVVIRALVDDLQEVEGADGRSALSLTKQLP